MRKCPKIEAVNAVVTLVSSLRMRSFSRTEFLTKGVCAGQINTQQLLASGASVRARVRFHLPLFFRRFHSSRRRRFSFVNGVPGGVIATIKQDRLLLHI